MKGRGKDKRQTHLFERSISEMVDPRHRLCKLAKAIPWQRPEEELSGCYSHTGKPFKPVRLMVSLLLLKQLYDLSDEVVVERWVENPCYQHFSGETTYQWSFPVHPTDLIKFRHRIGESGVEKILKMSIQLHGSKAREKEVVVDTTVQEKKVTFPPDAKLHRRIIEHYRRIAVKEGIKQWQSYRRVVKRLILNLRFGSHPRNRKKAAKASIAYTKTSGVIVGTLSFPRNIFDGHTLPEALAQVEGLTGKRPAVAICDRGYRGKSRIGETDIILPKPPKKTDTEYQKTKARKLFRRRAAIEPIIGHLKSDHRLNRLKSTVTTT